MSEILKSDLQKTELSELDPFKDSSIEFRKQRAIEIQKLLKGCKTATLIDNADCYLILKLISDDMYHFSICNMEYKYVMNFGYITYVNINKLLISKIYIYAYIDDKAYNLKI